jgi:hypothetical protein
MSNTELTAKKLAELISEYFKDLGAVMAFKDEPANGVLSFAAEKQRFLFMHDFNLKEWDELFKNDMGHHRLESLKGEFIFNHLNQKKP